MGEGEVSSYKGSELQFFGGPEDGATHFVAASAREYMLPAPFPPAFIGTRNELEELPEVLLTREVYVYRKQAQRGPFGVRLVMLYEGVRS